MRYGIIPTRVAERFALWFGRVPVPIADCLLPLVQTRALMASVRLGIIDALAAGDTSAADVAARCRLDADAVDMVLRVLASARYVTARRGRYALSSLGRLTLVDGAPESARSYVLFNYVQWEFIEKLEEVIRTGHGIEFHSSMKGTHAWEWYQAAMVNLSRIAAPVLARLVPVKAGARTLVDVGGSHGLLGAAICTRHPPMRSIVIELPAAIDEARAAAAGAGAIVEHRAADVLRDPIPAPADVVLLANIVHHFSRDEAIGVMTRARAAMSARATIAIWDFDRPKADATPELAADASALYFRLTSTSQVVPGEEYAAWLRAAGFGDVRVKRSPLAPVQVLVTGRKRT
ncbi:MAG: methyltransferase [Bacteroidales bacterium]